uniref:Uncharacterized protein n=1 Tax=Eubacterium cellulosolvens (strain ATCC 43171 / JCM 9499 / 6) TaxID=633697 RepID=I5ASH7_EUBC6
MLENGRIEVDETLFSGYQALIGYYNVNYICNIDSRRKEWQFNNFFEQYGTDTEAYTMEMIEHYFRNNGISYRRYFLMDNTRSERSNMTRFGEFLHQSWMTPEK